MTDVRNIQVEAVCWRNLRRIIQHGRGALLPPPKMTVSEWADTNRVLSEGAAEPGRWRTDRVPHTKRIMDCVTDPRVRMITVMGSSQIGKTEVMNNIAGYLIDVDPCNIIVMQPTDQDVRDYVNLKFDPMIEDTPCLKDKVSKKKSRSSDNSAYRKKYAGGSILFRNGLSTSSTRGRSAKVTIADDIDAIAIGATKEGDVVLRLINRSKTYPDHLNINISTPTIEGESRIESLYNASNMQKFYVKCVHCGKEILLIESQLSWEKDTDMFGKVIAQYPETVRYVCQECGCIITEQERIEILRAGEWKAERPEIVTHQGFWINELSSTLSSMVKVAGAMVKAENNPEAEEALYNTVFGRPYRRIRGEVTDPLELMYRNEDYLGDDLKIPNEVLLITASADVQGGTGEKEQRLEVGVYGWGRGEEAWVLYRGVIAGNLKQPEVWTKLYEFFQKDWVRKDGVKLRAMSCFVDSGYETQTVYDFTTGKQNKGIFAIKGSNKYGADLISRRVSLVNKDRTLLITVGTQMAKHELFTRLRNVKEPGGKYIHFTKKFCNDEYFRQITAEQAVRKSTGLNEYIVYEKKHKGDANEALDILVYCFAGMRRLMPNWDKIEYNIERSKEREKEVAQRSGESRNHDAKAGDPRAVERRPVQRGFRISI